MDRYKSLRIIGGLDASKELNGRSAFGYFCGNVVFGGLILPPHTTTAAGPCVVLAGAGGFAGARLCVERRGCPVDAAV